MKSILVTGANGTKRLACQAVSLGVKRFVSVSSIKVNGQKTRVLLDWTPPVSTAEGMERTVDWFLREGKQRNA